MERLLQTLNGNGDLPRSVVVPDALDLAFSKFWYRSAAQPYHEWGATLLQDDDGRLEAGEAIEGTEMTLWFGAALDDSKLAGIFHTHPYSDGTTGVAFSGADIAFVVNRGLQISIVQSGETRFLLANPASSRKAQYVDAQKLTEEMMEKIRRIRRTQRRVKWQQALEEVNLGICARFGLAFFRGKKTLRALYIGSDAIHD
jgi:proteasome lid subunit RPN8/RPN11